MKPKKIYRVNCIISELEDIAGNGCGYDQWRIASTKLSKYDTE